MINLELEKNIINGQFKRGRNLFLAASSDEIRNETVSNVTIEVSYNENICGYGFARYCYFLDENRISCRWANETLQVGMPFLINAYQLAFSYAIRLIELFPENPYGYYLALSIDLVPDGKMQEDEVLEIATNRKRKWQNDERADVFIECSKKRVQKENKTPKLFIQKMAEMVARDKRQAFKDLIIQGRFLESRLIRPDFFEHEIDTMLMEIARETYSICAYDYVWHWMRDMGRETAQKHLLMAEMTWFVGINTMSKETAHYDGTKELHFFHIYRAAELQPLNIKLQEKLLSLYEVGNESFDLDETKVLVERVLQVNPESEQALRVKKILV